MLSDSFGYGLELLREVSQALTLPIGSGLQVWHLYAVALILALAVGFITSWYRRD